MSLPSHRPPPPSAQHHAQQQPSNASLLPKEIALVCLVDEAHVTTQRWADLVGEGGYLDRFVQRLANRVPPGKLRLSLLSFSSRTDPGRSPLTHAQYFLAPDDFWASVRTTRPGVRSGETLHQGPPSPPHGAPGQSFPSPPRAAAARQTDTDQGLLEGLVSGLELFDLHTSHPFLLPSPSPSPPHNPPTPASQASPTASSSKASPPAGGAGGAGLMSASSANTVPAVNVERYLFAFVGEDLTPSWVAPSLSGSGNTSRWAAKRPAPPSSSSASANNSGGGGKARWNRTRRMDGLGWDTLPAEVNRRQVRLGLIGLGLGKKDSELRRAKRLLGMTATAPSETLWFQPKAPDDLVLIHSLDTRTTTKRPLPQGSPSSLHPPNSAAAAAKRQRLTPSGPLNIPSSVRQQQQPPLQPSQLLPQHAAATLVGGASDVNSAQMERLRTAQKLMEQEQALAAIGRLPGGGGGGSGNAANQLGRLGLSTQLGGGTGGGLALSAEALQGLATGGGANNNLAELSQRIVALHGPGGAANAAAGGQAGDLSDLLAQSNALAQQYHRQKMQAAAGPGGAIPPAAVNTLLGRNVAPPQPPLQQQQQATGGVPSRPARPTIWQGKISWSVAGIQPQRLECAATATVASASPSASHDFQTHIWPNALHLSAISPLNLQEIKVHASRGAPCISLGPGGTTSEDRAGSEKAFAQLVKNFQSKNTMGHVHFGPPGCGMVIFPVPGPRPGQQGGGAQPLQLMGIIFLKERIPFPVGNANNQQQQQQAGVAAAAAQMQQQQRQPLPPPINTAAASTATYQQQQQIRAQLLAHQQRQQQQQKQQQQQQQLQSNNFSLTNNNNSGGGGNQFGFTPDAMTADQIQALISQMTAGSGGGGGLQQGGWP